MMRLAVTSGRGPAECRIALARLLGALRAEAEAAGLAVDIAERPAPDTNGPGSAILLLDGMAADPFGRALIGTVQWIAPSPLRPHHPRKNWFVGIFMLAPEAAGGTGLDERDVRFEAFRAGGPGGQHQNRTESAVRAVHVPTGLAVIARDERSQHRNRALALLRLGRLLGARAELAAARDREAAWAVHDRLERGAPIRVYEGEAFRRVR